MKTWIALFRGINVGGNNILPMAELRLDLGSFGLKNVRTYIQSGNVVFESKEGDTAKLTEKIARRIENVHGFRPHIFLLSREELLAAIEANPFPEAVSEPKTLHFCFLAEPASGTDLRSLDDVKSTSERYRLTGTVFYLHAPDGIGRSKLAAVVEKRLGVVTTTRNYRTVEKLWAMVKKD